LQEGGKSTKTEIIDVDLNLEREFDPYCKIDMLIESLVQN
jgi:hypothetical protein